MGARTRISKVVVLVTLTGALGACKSGIDGPVDPLPDSGIAPCEGVYPDAGAGDTLPCITFTGYARPGEGTGESERVEVSTADFYNPSGDAVYGPGSAFGEGEPKPRALLINGSALWCNPCKNEAQQLLPVEYAELHPQGMEFMVIVVEGAHIGDAATFDDLDAWIDEFGVTYSAVLDPANQLGLDTESFPANLLVDTQDMTIVEDVKGIPQDSFWAKAEDLLGD